ncbi:hypothetical protein [Natronococcus occultus]|uniref:hypothetical protein n=1 Tax=Natronococcus occultus TaxID=29288 RepID=UPI0012FC4EAD|nr:hypothetical protein [Natronococcus occultus]
MSNTYIQTQQAFIDGLKASADAVEHYSHAYELWLNGWEQTFRTDPKLADPEKETQSPTPRSLVEPSNRFPRDRDSSARQSHAPSKTRSDAVLRERIATLEQRQQALEETLNEIHREVVE